MKRLRRLAWVLGAAAALAAVGAAAWSVLKPTDPGPTPLPLRAGEREIVFLEPATSTGSSWEQFVAAVQRSARRLEGRFPGLHADLETPGDPEASVAVPQVALTCPSNGQRLVFRWYKITSEWRTTQWVNALLHKRAEPPLAVVGGSYSSRAARLAYDLEHLGRDLPAEQRPLLVLTTATADLVPDPARPEEAGPPPPEEGVRLITLYPGRTFRFCFTNRRMAEAVSDFIWGQPDLRPDGAPYYTVNWVNDPYSHDLVNGFINAVQSLAQADAAFAAAGDWAWCRGGPAPGPAGLLAGLVPPERFGLRPPFRTDVFNPYHSVDSAVGDPLVANSFEKRAARLLLDDLTALPPDRQRALLVLTGQGTPTRRFLRALAEEGTQQARRCVVATGDTVSFNSVYRDRETAWPITELPCKLVFFCHRNPMSPDAGFQAQDDPPPDPQPPWLNELPNPMVQPPTRPRPADGAPGDPWAGGPTATDDLILYTDIVERIVESAWEGGPCRDAEDMCRRLAAAQRRGRPRFDAEGERMAGTGEHLVCLRPAFQGDLALPEATLEVWHTADGGDGTAWERREPPPGAPPRRLVWSDLPSRIRARSEP